MAGLQFRETMSGTYTLAKGAAPPRRLSFAGQVQIDDPLRNLRDGHFVGTLEMEGFAEYAPLEGLFEIDLGRHSIRFDLGFTGDDGRQYRLLGLKTITLLNFIGSITRMVASIRDSDSNEVASGPVKFDLREELLPMLRSVKVRLA